MHDMHTPHPQSQEPQQSLLSAQQVQLMLGIDRSTVYRMAEDGRLPAIKVGKQWRFPSDDLQSLLRGGRSPRGVRPDGTTAPPLSSDRDDEPALNWETAASVTQVAADLLGVMMVVTDMDGHPVTSVANPCPWFVERADDPTLLDACTTEWQLLADDPDFEPRFAVGALGFECARAFIRSGTSLVGMVLVGGIAPEGSSTPGLYHLDGDRRRTVLTALPRVATALSRISPRTPDVG